MQRRRKAEDMKKAKVVKTNATPGSEMLLKRENVEDKLLRNERALLAAPAPSSAARVAAALQVRVERRLPSRVAALDREASRII
jgi:hypothetical protein